MKLHVIYHQIIQSIKSCDFIVLFSLRLYLAPIFIIAGWGKLQNFSDMVEWFGNSDWGLGLPAPELMLVLAIIAELVGGFALLFGLLTRLFSFMLIITMLVAAFKVHWSNGWFAITPTDTHTSIATVLNQIGFWGSEQSLQNSMQASERLERAKEILQTHGNYEWLTETGNFVILNNGIEFSITYLLMLCVLFIYGAGKYISLDYLCNYFYKK